MQMFDGRVQLLHRWIFGVTGRGYRQIVDHLNRDVLDNRRANLRVVDPSVSNANRSVSDREGLGAFQVRSGRWQAKFRWRGQRIYLGTFDTEGDAAAAIRAYRRRHAPDSIPPPRAPSP